MPFQKSFQFFSIFKKKPTSRYEPSGKTVFEENDQSFYFLVGNVFQTPICNFLEAENQESFLGEM